MRGYADEIKWSPRSGLSEIIVGKYGSARYSCLSVRETGKSGGTAETMYLFALSQFDSGRFSFGGDHDDVSVLQWRNGKGILAGRQHDRMGEEKAPFLPASQKR